MLSRSRQMDNTHMPGPGTGVFVGTASPQPERYCPGSSFCAAGKPLFWTPYRIYSLWTTDPVSGWGWLGACKRSGRLWGMRDGCLGRRSILATVQTCKTQGLVADPNYTSKNVSTVYLQRPAILIRLVPGVSCRAIRCGPSPPHTPGKSCTVVRTTVVVRAYKAAGSYPPLPLAC